MPLTDEDLRHTKEVYEANGRNQTKAAAALGISRSTLQERLAKINDPVIPIGHVLRGKSTLVKDGEVVMEWFKTSPDDQQRQATLDAILDGLKSELPREEIIAKPTGLPNESLLSQYTITDVHLGCLAWDEETGGGDYDVGIAERLLVDWFAMAIAASPQSKTAILAQLGDFMHYDGFKSVTPEHGHVLDADSRYPKMVEASVRVLRRVIRMLLTKHEKVHVIMCDANHDPAGGVWLRQMFSVLYENEPRVTVDTNPGTYTCYEWGDVSLFYHHGHKRGMKDLDAVFAGKFREIYGRTKFSYAHKGHLHADELKTTHLMKVEQHETLAAPDAYAANGGWMSGRSAKVIHYHKRHGEVSRTTISAQAVME